MAVVRVTCALIERQGKLLVAQRARGKALEGRWEFPGGKIAPGESPEACVCREVVEELGCQVQIESKLSPVSHAYNEVTVELMPFHCILLGGEPEALEHKQIVWMKPSAIRALDLAQADIAILEEYLTKNDVS